MEDAVEQLGEVSKLALDQGRDLLGNQRKDGADNLGNLAGNGEERVLKLGNQGSSVDVDTDEQLVYKGG